MVPSENGEMTRNIQMKGGPPELLKRFGERLASGNLQELSFTLSLDYIEERSRLAMIRIAYLLMFAERGYTYILGEGPSVIRKILSGGILAREHEIWRVADQLQQWEFSDSDRHPESFILTLVSPNQTLSHMMLFRITEGKERYFSVLLPARDERAEYVIPQLHALSDMTKGQPLSLTIRR